MVNRLGHYCLTRPASWKRGFCCIVPYFHLLGKYAWLGGNYRVLQGKYAWHKHCHKHRFAITN